MVDVDALTRGIEGMRETIRTTRELLDKKANTDEVAHKLKKKANIGILQSCLVLLLN